MLSVSTFLMGTNQVTSLKVTSPLVMEHDGRLYDKKSIYIYIHIYIYIYTHTHTHTIERDSQIEKTNLWLLK